MSIVEKNGIVYELNTSQGIGIVKYSDSKIQEAKILPNVNGCTIKEIASKAFYYCENLKKVTIPPCVTKIKNEAFAGCSKLATINNVQNELLVKNIGMKAFKNCTSLKGVKLNGVLTLGENAFEGCENLLYVTFDDSLEIIEKNTFLNCTSLQNMIFPKKMRIVKDAFMGCENIKQMTFLNDNLDVRPFIMNINKNVMLLGRDGSKVQEMLIYGYAFQLIK